MLSHDVRPRPRFFIGGPPRYRRMVVLAAVVVVILLGAVAVFWYGRAEPSTGATGDAAETLSDETRVAHHAVDAGGQLPQQALVARLDWSEAKMRRVTTRLVDDGLFDKIRTGRRRSERPNRIPSTSDRPTGRTGASPSGLVLEETPGPRGVCSLTNPPVSVRCRQVSILESQLLSALCWPVRRHPPRRRRLRDETEPGCLGLQTRFRGLPGLRTLKKPSGAVSV